MCKRKRFLGLVFLFLWASSAPYLFAEQGREFSSTENIQTSETQSKRQTPENYSEDSEPLPQNLNEPKRPLLNPSSPWDDLRRLIGEGLQGLSESSESLNALETELAALKAETKEQRELYSASQKLLTQLKQSLAEAQNSVDIAVDRMKDAEGYAQYMDAQNRMLKQETARLKKSAPVGFVFGGISFGVGVPLLAEGLRTDNKTMLWSGVGVMGLGSVVWVAGHYIFQWW